MGNKQVKTPIGMVSSYFWPISSEQSGMHPVYGTRLDMGAAVKGYLTVKTVTAAIEGDDALLVPIELFSSGQLDAETTLNDLEINAAMFGHDYTSYVERSNAEDVAASGGYGFIQSILKSDKTIVYRATFLRKVTAILSSEKQESDTKKENGLSPKMNAVSFTVLKDALDDWRLRQDFSSLSDAEAYLQQIAGSTQAYAVRISHHGTGVSTPGAGTIYVSAGGNQQISFTADPSALYDNGALVTGSIASHKYTISSISADHDVLAIWTT